MNKKALLKWTSIALGVLFVLLIVSSFINNDVVITLFSSLFAIAFVIESVLLIMYFVSKKKNQPKEKKAKKQPKQVGIKKVKVLGVRTGEETGILATWNFALYSVLVIYDNGKKEVLELKSDSKLFKDLLPYINVDETRNIGESKPYTDEELDTYDLIDKD